MLSKIGSTVNSAVKKIFNTVNQVNNEKKQIINRLSQKANNTFGTNGHFSTPQQRMLDAAQSNKNQEIPLPGAKVSDPKAQWDRDVEEIIINEQRNVNPNNLAKLDVIKELPKLTVRQIEKIIGKHFSDSPVVSTADAQGIYDAQMKSGMSALAVLGIGALESAHGTSEIAKKKGNMWGWNATNDNPMDNATKFSSGGDGAYEFSNAFLKTYYDKYGAKSIYSAGTGDNPAGMGYAYNKVNGRLEINPQWATAVDGKMKMFYQTALSND